MALARRTAHHLASTGGGAGRRQIVGWRRLEPISGGYQRSVHRGACGASLETPRAGRRTQPANPAASFACVLYKNCTQGCGVFRPRRSARPRISAGQTSGTTRALFASRERGRLAFSPLVREFPLLPACGEKEARRGSGKQDEGHTHCPTVPSPLTRRAKKRAGLSPPAGRGERVRACSNTRRSLRHCRA
jgi:hypothetical protein